jgi:hypothetical protein
MVQFRDLWYGHPINESVMTPCLAPDTLTNMEGRLIRQHFPVFGNQCAIRMGVALKRAGVTLGQLKGCTTCGVHHADDMHIINAAQLGNAIRRGNLPGVGQIEIYSGDDARQFYPKIFGRTGMMYISDYWSRSTDRSGSPTGDHIDVWNGYRSSAKWLMEWFSWAGYYSNYAQAREIWFWEVK